LRTSKAIFCLLFSFIVGIALPATPQDRASASALLATAEARLRTIYERRELDAKAFRGIWLPDGSGYTLLENAAGSGGRELVKYDAASGIRTVLLSQGQLVPAGAGKPLAIEDYLVSPDGGRILVQTNGRPGEEGRRRVVDYWIFERTSGTIREAVKGADAAPLRNSFSPDGSRIIFMARQNLNVVDLRSGKSSALTTDGAADSISYGNAAWSPDGARIAFVRTDSSALGLRPLVDPIEPTYPKVRYVRFAVVGSAIPELRVGVAAAEGGAVRWIALPAAPKGFYFGDVSWAGNSDELLVEQQSRGRDAREFLLADVRTGKTSRLYRETDPAWVEASYATNAGLEWIRGGRSFVLLTEKDGWRHAYIGSRGGGPLTLLTPGPSDIIARGKVAEKDGWFYYLASPENATQKYLYRIKLDGSGKAERVTPADQPGTHAYVFSPDARWAFHTYSTFDAPPRIEIVNLPEHKVVRVLEDNGALRAKLGPWITRPTEFFKIDIGGGVVMDAWMIKPRDFDPSRKYPLFIFVYGEPHGQTVLDDWSGGQGHSLFHRIVADLGYIVVSMDNRGTPAPKGAAWRRVIFPSLGPLSTEEQAAGVKELGRTRPYVDLSRVGIWGWSGGGSNTLNALFRKPDVYHVGIAVAPKPQPHLYNAWFQEIYMRTREENPDGYAKSAPIAFAEGLKGDLLIVQGTGETNTHIQITEGLVDRLIELGKRFDYMSYPHRDHGLSEGKGTPLHLRVLMTRYLLEHLPPGPR
jgi:dipeptidyl-peptidase 4